MNITAMHSVTKSSVPVILCALASLVCACSDIQEPSPPVAWQGELVGAAAAPFLSGSAAMASQVLATQIGIGIENGPANAIVQWRARTGTCTGTGAAVASAGAFPSIQLSDDGIGNAEMSLNRRLNADDTYAIEVLQRNNNVDVRLACADLIRRN